MCEVVHTRATCTQLLHDCYDCYRLKRGPPDKGAIGNGARWARQLLLWARQLQ